MTESNQQAQVEMDMKDSEQLVINSLHGEESIDLNDYEIVSAEFFAQIKEPAFTINVNKITANAASVRMMPDVEYVKILVNQNEKKLVLKPCDELDISGYKWARTKDGKRYASQRTGEPFVLIICQLMDWNPDYRYKILGKKCISKGEDVLVFDLTVAQVFEKAPKGENGGKSRRIMPAEWNGSFGPKFGESHRSLQIDTFEGYKVFSIKGDKKKTDKTTGDNGKVKNETDATDAGSSADETQGAES